LHKVRPRPDDVFPGTQSPQEHNFTVASGVDNWQKNDAFGTNGCPEIRCRDSEYSVALQLFNDYVEKNSRFTVNEGTKKTLMVDQLN